MNNPLKHTDPSGHSPLAIAMFIPGAQEIAALVTGYLILKWSFEQLSRAIETMPTINLGLKLPGFDRSAKPPPSVESPTQADLKYTPEGMGYTEMPETSVLKASGLPKTGHRYVGPGEAEEIRRNNEVPNVNKRGESKAVYYTPEKSLKSGSKAKEKYNLYDKPTHRVDLDISRTKADYGGNVVGGKGIEMTTREKIPAKRVIRLGD